LITTARLDAKRHLPFNRLYRTGNEQECIRRALQGGWTAGNGPQSARCEALLLSLTHACRILLTHSCTGALEMAALLARVGPGDEVIMPSFTFASTALAFVLRGAVAVFVDVDPQTLNIDPRVAEEAITPRTKALVAVHYAGVGCDMNRLTEIARAHHLRLIEDAAQGVGASLHGRVLGTIGHIGTFSFHGTKNISCGEGGALLLNDERLVERAEYLHEKGTNRLSFRRGDVDHYTWMDLGSSFAMSDFTAALLADQLEHLAEITEARLRIWNAYHAALEPLENAGLLRRPTIPGGANHNAHLYRIMLRDRPRRDAMIASLAENLIEAQFHYVPLHSSPAGRRYGRVCGTMRVTDAAAESLVRLPLWVGMTLSDVDRVASAVGRALRRTG
jgi:dTDP-4-amino-4,6-dideoxygalactose transaminase